MRYFVLVLVARNPEGDYLKTFDCHNWRGIRKVLRRWHGRLITITRSR